MFLVLKLLKHLYKGFPIACVASMNRMNSSLCKTLVWYESYRFAIGRSSSGRVPRYSQASFSIPIDEPCSSLLADTSRYLVIINSWTMLIWFILEQANGCNMAAARLFRTVPALIITKSALTVPLSPEYKLIFVTPFFEC